MSGPGGKTILLVEDETIIAMAQTMALERFGFKAINAGSGEKAVSLALENREIGLVLMDIDLGKGIDGTEAARRILAARTLPIVFLTSHAEREMVEKVRGITRYGYVIKNSGDFVLESSIEMAFELFDAHQETKGKETELEAIYENAPIIMMLLDEDRRVRKANGNTMKFLGRPLADILGLRAGEAMRCLNSFESGEGCGFGRECEACMVRETVLATFETGVGRENVVASMPFRVEGNRVDFHFLLSTKRLIIADKPLVLASLMDITVRKRAEDALTRSEHRNAVLNRIANVFLTISDESAYAKAMPPVLSELGSKVGLFGYFGADGALVVSSLTEEAWEGAGIPGEAMVIPDSSSGDGFWARLPGEKRPFIAEGPVPAPGKDFRIQRLLVAPIVFGGMTIGIIAVGDGERDYGEEEKRILEEIALYISPILNARLQRDRKEEERKRAATELARVNRELRMLSDSNHALVRTQDEPSLLNEICRIAVEVGGYRMAWVGFAEQDEDKTLLPVAHAGFDEGYVGKARISWGDNERGRGPGGVAIRTAKPCIIRDVEGDPSFAPWREAAVSRGFRSIVVLPLIHEERAFGALGIYSAEVDVFDAGEMAVLTELAGDLSFGIVALRTRAKRDQAEKALERQYSTLRGIIDGTDALICSVDRQYRYTSFNTGYAASMKARYGAQIEIGNSLLECMSVAEDRDSAKRNIDKALLGEGTLKESFSGEDARSRRYYQISHGSIRDGSGEIIGAAIFAQDMTERKRAEELERRNAELRELDRLKSLFIASMSHELRTPLNSIIGFSSIIGDEWVGPVNPEQRENIAVIHRSGKLLLSLINNVIDVSELESGTIEAHFEEFDLYGLLEEGARYVGDEIRRKGLALRLPIRHQTLYTDRRRLLQCVINLLLNAVRFTEKGEVRLSSALSEDRRASPPLSVSISVRDTGIGMAEEDLRRLFEPFVRLDSRDKARASGAGIGLYLTRRLVAEILQGEIGCESVVGEGSEFTLRLPERVDEKRPR